MLSIYSFKSLVKRYRESQGGEITNYAMNYNYMEYIQGRSTPLIDRMEMFYECRLQDVLPKPAFRVEEEPKPIKPAKPIKPKHDFENIDEFVLPYAKNKVNKSQTNEYASKMGKKFFIGQCTYHDDTLYYVKGYSFFCCCCRYTNNKAEIKRTVQRLIDSSRQAAQKSTVKGNNCEPA
jgi:hypothetical protein